MKSDSEILNIVCKVYGDGDFSEADPVVAIDAGLVSLITPHRAHHYLAPGAKATDGS